MADTQRLGRHRQAGPEGFGTRAPRRRRRLAAAIVAASVAVAIFAALVVSGVLHLPQGASSAPGRERLTPPATPDHYIGLYTEDAPSSYNGVTTFTAATGVKPRIVLYYNGWLEPFQVGFATAAARHGAVPLVQLDPENVSIAAVAAGKYDAYLRAYAKAVIAYARPVILSFGHEMNGYWYSWGYLRTSPAVFVAAWRHIVTLFQTLGAHNVTWLWTINTIHKRANVPSPGPWWPGASYVNWVGIDGYYFNPSSTFAAIFGPTIAAVRTLTHDPILISETAAPPSASQPTKIADLFSGVRLYGLLGFVWFDATHDAQDWRLNSPAAFAAFRHAAETYHRPAS